MILTLTPNAALDRIIFIDEFQAGTVMRPERMVDAVGGKGLDSSVALRTLGFETTAISFMAGRVGRRLVELLDGYDIRHDLIWLEGETRLAHVLVERKHQRHSHVIVGTLPVTEAAVTEFFERLARHLANAEWVIAAGSLPGGMPVSTYRQVIDLARAANVPVLIDSSGPAMRECLSSPPTILKLNWQEFTQTFDQDLSHLAALHSAARTIYDHHHLENLIITCGDQGLLAITPEGDYQAIAPIQQVVNAAGAGDAASAALVWRLTLGDGLQHALPWAAAVSAAVVLTEGTADCHRADAERLLPQVVVRTLYLP